MTHSSQLKTLKELVEKLGDNFIILNIVDTWEIEPDKDFGIKRSDKVRDNISLKDVYTQFVNKTGVYNTLRFTKDFREFIKVIIKPNFEPFIQHTFYQDTYDKFHEEWNKLHPDKSYEDWEKEQHRKRKGFIDHMMNLYMSYAYDSGPFGPLSLFGCKLL